MSQIFKEFYINRSWGADEESASGRGSSVVATKNLRENLPFLLKKFEIKSILDIPCGDFNWMKEVDLGLIDYHGADVVEEIISDNQIKYPNVKFSRLDMIEDSLPKVDLVLCRDCLFHFPFDLIQKALANIKKSGATYLLATSHTWNNFPSKDIKLGDFRKLNLQREPINLPAPLDFIVEGNQEYMQQDRCMLLWKCKDIP